MKKVLAGEKASKKKDKDKDKDKDKPKKKEKDGASPKKPKGGASLSDATNKSPDKKVSETRNISPGNVGTGFHLLIDAL